MEEKEHSNAWGELFSCKNYLVGYINFEEFPKLQVQDTLGRQKLA